MASVCKSGDREQRQPCVHARVRDGGDRRAGTRIAFADREVQIFDIGREMLFERERHDLRELGAALQRQHRLGEQHVGAGHEHDDFATGGCARRRDRARPD